jgi:hypothetical protein
MNRKEDLMENNKTLKTSRKVVGDIINQNTVKPAQIPSDVTKTLEALKTISKKRDPKLRKEILATLSKQTKKLQKVNQKIFHKTGPFFNSSIPLNVTPEALEIIQQYKHSSNEVIEFPKNLIDGGEVVCINNSTKPATKRVIGIFRKLYIETNEMKMDISNMGFFIQTLESDHKLLEFIIKVPSLPGILHSQKFNDQGGLTHQLRISHGNNKKNG